MSWFCVNSLGPFPTTFLSPLQYCPGQVSCGWSNWAEIYERGNPCILLRFPQRFSYFSHPWRPCVALSDKSAVVVVGGLGWTGWDMGGIAPPRDFLMLLGPLNYCLLGLVAAAGAL